MLAVGFVLLTPRFLHDLVSVPAETSAALPGLRWLVGLVRGLTFRVEKGEVFGFLGPSGAGKSTTQKILIALQRDYEGTVTILGRDLRQWRSDRNRTPAPLCS
jgi:ABC-type oligopeptide transport system ATPase subunit